MTDMIYVDLDNVYSAVIERNDVNEETAAYYIDWTIARVKRNLDSEAKMKVFGNQEYLAERLKLECYSENGNVFVDTPFANKRGKTCADGLIMCEMFTDIEHIDRFILFSSDIDFYPICQMLKDMGKHVVVATHGHSSYKLRHAATEYFPIIHWDIDLREYWIRSKSNERGINKRLLREVAAFNDNRGE